MGLVWASLLDAQLEPCLAYNDKANSSFYATLGYFIDSNITFRAFVNASIDTAASMPVNSPIGNASNFDISGNLDRTFLVYRGSGGMLYQSNNDDCQYYMDYYAA